MTLQPQQSTGLTLPTRWFASEQPSPAGSREPANEPHEVYRPSRQEALADWFCTLSAYAVAQPDPDLIKAVDGAELSLVPLDNPDGYEFSQNYSIWRKAGGDLSSHNPTNLLMFLD